MNGGGRVVLCRGAAESFLTCYYLLCMDGPIKMGRGRSGGADKTRLKMLREGMLERGEEEEKRVGRSAALAKRFLRRFNEVR